MTTLPSPELVTTALLSTLMPTAGVSTVLPKVEVTDARGRRTDNWAGKSTWITVKPLTSNDPQTVPIRRPVVQIHVWGKPEKANDRTYWGKAASVVEDLISFGTDWTNVVEIGMPFSGYYAAAMSSFSPRGGTRVEGDPQGFAHFVLDAILSYSFVIDTSPSGTSFGPFTFTTPSTTWTVPHGLARLIEPVIVNSEGVLLEAQVDYPDDNTLVITFNHSQTGVVYLAQGTFLFPGAATTWNIRHDMGRYPHVDVIGTDNLIHISGISHLNRDNLLVLFNAPMSGKAVLS